MASTINTASEAAQRGDWTACLEALLELWRPERPVELAALIERVGKRIPERHTTTPTSADITPLLGKLPLHEIDRLIELSNQVGYDPRIATRLAALYETSPIKRTEGRLDLRVLAALDAIDDPRYRQLIVRAADSFARQSANPTKLKRIETLVATATEVRTRPPPARFVIPTAITIELDRHVDPDQLLDAIYANPDDTAARLVYADKLQELGDPRGEFIALQCTDTLSGKRQRKALAMHERDWLGALRNQVRDVKWARGFPTVATLARTFASPPVDREWQLIEGLDLDRFYGESIAQLLQSMRSLRRVARMWPSEYKRFDLPLPWTSFGIRGEDREFAKLFTANRHTVLPHLEELDLSACWRPTQLLVELGDLAGLRVRLKATMQEHVNYLLERHATIVIVKQYEFQVSTHVTIEGGVATTNDRPFLASLGSIIPRTIKT